MALGAGCVPHRVVNGIQTSDIRNLFNPENIFISKEGGGAGNNWASGFTQGEQVQETLLDMIGEMGGVERCGRRVMPHHMRHVAATGAPAPSAGMPGVGCSQRPGDYPWVRPPTRSDTPAMITCQQQEGSTPLTMGPCIPAVITGC